MLFEWNDDTISYYARAAEYTGFFRNLAAMVGGELDENSVVFDAGCGPGLIDMELAPHVRKVISVDHNEGVIRYLTREAERRGITNIEAHIADVMSCADMEYDTLIACFFGHPGDEMLRLIDGARQSAVIITHAYTANKDSGAATKDSGAATYIEKIPAHAIHDFLAEAGYSFSEDKREIEFGQPFLSEEDALHYFDLYSHDKRGNKDKLAELVPTGKAQYPLYRPKPRPVSIFRVSARK